MSRHPQDQTQRSMPFPTAPEMVRARSHFSPFGNPPPPRLSPMMHHRTAAAAVGAPITVAGPSTVVKKEIQPNVAPAATVQRPSSPLPPSTAQHPPLPQPPSTVQQPPPLSLPTANPIPDYMLYKNRLHQYTQRSGLPLPVYQTVNEGSDHAPRFRSTVSVDGASYTSLNTYSHRKSAEQDVSQFALESVTEKMKDEGYSIIHEDPVFCKSILHEFATKMNMGMPIYSTTKSAGLISSFVSSLVFNGVTYDGGPGRSKKEAEQLGARAVILSLLGNPEFGTVLWYVVKSKFKLYAALHKVKGASNKQNSISSVCLRNENSNQMLLCNEIQVPVVGSQQPSSTSISTVSRQQMPQSPVRNTLLHEVENAGVNVPSQGSHPQIESVPPCFQQSTVFSASDKKRLRRQKQKANKRARVEAELGAASMALGSVLVFGHGTGTGAAARSSNCALPSNQRFSSPCLC